jgi:type VI secretion system secreted protein VgrG
MAESKSHTNAMVWMSGSYPAKDMLLKRAIVREKLSTLTETTIEFQSKNKAVKLAEIIGRTMSIHIKTASSEERKFSGTVVSVENLGLREGYGHYVAEVRPWFWMLTRTQDCRIFQEKTAVEIIEQIFSETGFTDYTNSLSDTPAKRTYCVQYRESDFDFICRLMEEEGIYYYFDNKMAENAVEKLILCDGISGHVPVPEESTLEFHARDKNDRRRDDHIAEWVSEENLTRGKVTLNDFDFLSPTADLKAPVSIEKGTHKHNDYEVYDPPGHYRKETELGKNQARVRMEAEAVRHQQWRGAGSVRTLGTGYTFKLKEHPEKAANIEYLVTDATHYFQVSTDFTEDERRRDLATGSMDFPEEMESDAYACTFGAIPKKEQFRAPLITPWPEIPGLHTATVVGNSGEEITTDEYGRIKVQFHWDREGKKDEKSSCWIRVVTPWSGKGWGAVAIPRMGQEVVIQFEEGDPDRPICTGMLYNKDTMPPYTLPDNKTQSGVMTNSSKEGGGYNELMFEDKKDAEMMRLQAQKDHEMLIKNKSVVTVGLDEIDAGDHDGDGSLSQVVKQNVTETIQEGDHFFTIETGSQEIEIKTDKTQTITANYDTTVEQGNMTVDVSAGKIEMEAAQEILLKVGSSSIKIDNSGVTIKGMMIKIEGTAMAEMKSPMSTVKGETMLILKGGVTMIN